MNKIQITKRFPELTEAQVDLLVTLQTKATAYAVEIRQTREADQKAGRPIGAGSTPSETYYQFAAAQDSCYMAGISYRIIDKVSYIKVA